MQPSSERDLPDSGSSLRAGSTDPIAAWVRWLEHRGRGAVALTALAGLVLLAVLVRAGASPPVDFEAYDAAALAIREGRSPYADALTWKAAGYVTGGLAQQPTARTAFVYPPALALALLPLTTTSLRIANAIWAMMLAGSVVGAAVCLVTLVSGAGAGRRVGRERLPRRQLVLAVLVTAILLVAFKPIRGALSFSKQVDPLILLLLVGTLATFVRRRDGWAAVVLALAVAVKPFLAILGLWLLWKRAYRAALLAGGLSAVLVLGPLLGLGRLGEYVEVAAYWSGPSMVASPVSQSLASLLDRTLTVQPYTVPLVVAPWLVGPLWLGVGLCLLGLLAVTVRRSRSEPSLEQALELGLVVAAMLVFGPLTEEHHLAYLVPGLAATLTAGVVGWRRSRAARWLACLTAALVAVMMLPGTQDVAWGFYRFREGPIPVPLSFVTGFWLYVIVAALVLNVAALRLCRQNVG